MKKMLLLMGCALATAVSFAQNAQPEIAIIPEPVSITKNTGTFTLPQQLTIAAGSSDSLKPVLTFLKDHLSKPTGLPVNVGDGANAAVQLVLNKTPDAPLGTEGYKLSVKPNGAIITANATAGLFYGVQTLLQLFPKEIESDSAVANINWQAPCVEITDYPRFGWRGLMLDVSRHFFTKEDVKRYIDDMARYKFNLLHLGLTNDEGWRIEIKSLPNLTKVGAWNVKKTGYFGTFSKPAPKEPRNYGGFYTQDDIRELVQYAKDHYMNILPEINMPGHSLAAIASYPELACVPGGGEWGVSSGEKIKDWSPKHVALVDDNLCPANEAVYQFVDKVVTEVAQLFPFEYIHMGGDETFKTFWEKSDAIKALMKREGLKSMEEVQAYFTKRIEKIVNSKGKKFIGWDEILEGGITPTAAVMSWRGVKGGIAAAKAKHEVVMSPTTYAYLDYMQADPVIEPRVYDALRFSKAYQFEPVPEGVDARYIKGGQANLWTEQIYNLRTAQYMTWPRALATAESVWSPKEKKNWANFFSRVEKHFERFDVAEIKYARAVYDPIFTVTQTGNDLQVALDKEVADLDIYYTVDNSFPDRFSEKYTGPITMPKDAAMLRVITYRGKTPMGRVNTMTIEEMKKRVTKR